MDILFFCLVPKADLYSSLADEFSKNGHRVTFVTPTEEQTRFKDLGQHRVLYFHAGKMLNVSIPRKGINNLLFPYNCLKAVMRYINPLEYKLILMSTPPLGYLSSIRYLKEKNPSIKFYLILRDIHPEGAGLVGLNKIPFLYKYFRKQAASLYDLSDIVGCMSPHSVHYITNEYMNGDNSKIKLLPNWGRKSVYVNPNRDVLKKYHLEDKYIIIYGGNMGITQNLGIFLKLAKEECQLKDVVFLFIGTGTEKEKLKAQAREEGLDSIQIEDYIPKEEYDEILKCANVGIISLHPKSFFANIPSKAVSYWENKIPILASLDDKTDFGSFFLDKSNTGLWSLATDFNSLKKNFETLYYDPDLRVRMGENGRRFFEENFTVDKTYKSIIDILNN